ncbi:MAG: hypothetical protein HDQ88_07255, partial [Clostridia bacterium]|nr:hypothetical protein [Clostridia bacterium]
MEDFINFDKAEKINVYNDGQVKTYNAGVQQYSDILNCWNETVKDAHDMPAFGVSLNNYTVEEMKKGLWVEFDFNKTLTHNEMPFERLLINVNDGNSGFNLIRYNGECGYDGRCFYFDLVEKTTTDLYNLLLG